MRHLLLYICLLLSLPVLGQGSGNTGTEEQLRLIYFKDKENSPYSLQRPEEFLSGQAVARRERQRISLTARDLPVNPAYVAGLKEAGVRVWYTSRWFNAAVVQASDVQVSELAQLTYVKNNRTLNQAVPAPQLLQTKETIQEATAPMLTEQDYGPAFHQADMLGADELHREGFAGEGMTIAIFDTGFPNVNALAAFAPLYQEGRLKGTFDFVRKQEQVYSSNSHGTAVLSTMAALDPGTMVGTAYKANYLLLRTEDVDSEQPIEEINWLLAAEYADSAGADIINSSLGYSRFDNPNYSYTYSDLDGNTTLVARAADYAAATGMLVVVSAGNEGNDSWRYISSPADADSVLTVGAVDSLGAKASFSSFGPTADGQLKPDVAALGFQAYVLTSAGRVVQANGTSFASPIMAGFAACLWQANPGLNNIELLELLRASGSNAAAPNNSIGYGVPNYARTLTATPGSLTDGKAAILNPIRNTPVVLTLGQEWQGQPVQVQVLDATGKVMHRELLQHGAARQELQLQPRHLQPGLYLCRLTAAGRATTVRFIKL